MGQISAPFLVAILLATTVSQAKSAAADDTVDQNVRIMVEAARTLKLSPASSGRAYLLVKQETVRSAVAVIFGYVDNGAACNEIAEVLSDALQVGTFQCDPIH